MKNNLLKKLISCALVSVITVGLLAGCGNSDSKKESSKASSQSSEASASQDTAKEVTYPIDTDVTLTWAMVPDPKVTANYTDILEAPFFKGLMERTGVKLEIVYAADAKALELMMMGDDLPDIVQGVDSIFPGGKQVAVEDGIILPLDDYLADYMPDFKAVLEGDTEYKQYGSLADGRIYGTFHGKETFEQLQTGGIIYRKDWLDDLGMEPPRTPDQFYDMLKAFKEKKGAEVPLSTTYANLKNMVINHSITDGFGLVTTGWYHMDGTVHYGYYDPETKDVLQFMNKLYKDGLLDPEFATLDAATEKSNILTGRSGALRLLSGSVDSYRKSQEDPNYHLTGLESLVQKEGDTARGGMGSGKGQSDYTCITTACKNPEIAAMFLNYGFTEEGQLYYNFGTEGSSYTFVDGQPTFTDLIMKNPDGWTYGNACSAYAHGNYPGPFVQFERYCQQALSTDPHRVQCFEQFKKTGWKNYVIPGTVTIPLEYQDEYNKLAAEVDTFIDEMVVGYITGAKSFDKYETEFTGTLKSLKMDRLIEIKQIAYDAMFK